MTIFFVHWHGIFSLIFFSTFFFLSSRFPFPLFSGVDWCVRSQQVLFNKETEGILGVHIIGLHAADLIQECSNAVAAGTTVRELSMMVSAKKHQI